MHQLTQIQIQFSDSSLSYSSDSSDDDYYNRRRRDMNNKNKRRSKTSLNNPTKKCTNLTAKLLKDVRKSKSVKLKLDEDTLQHLVYLISIMNSPKCF